MTNSIGQKNMMANMYEVPWTLSSEKWKTAMPNVKPTGYFVRILLTGFLPFDGFRFNTSAVVVRRISKEMIEVPQPCRIVLKKVILPANKAAYRILRKRTDVNSYDIILHLGQAEYLRSLALERYSHNRVMRDLRLESRLWTPNRPIVKGGPPVLEASLPYARIWSRICSERLPVHESVYAGTHMCNSILYQSLLNARKENLKQMIGLLHITSFHKVPVHEAIRTLRVILDTCVFEVVRQESEDNGRVDSLMGSQAISH